MKDLGELFEKFRVNTFLIARDRNVSYGEFFDHCSKLRQELEDLRIGQSKLTLRPNNSISSLAMIFSLASLKMRPRMVSRRDKGSVFFDRDKMDKLNEQALKKKVKPLSILLDSEILFWTSGTSGKPKEAVLTFSNFYFNALGSHENIPFSQGDSWLLSLPIEHVGGLSIVFRALINGGTVILTEPGEEYLPPDTTHLSFVATQLYRYLKNPTKLPKLKAFLLGGSAMPLELIEKALNLGLKVHKSYGMTEMASQITTTKNWNKEELQSSGQVLPHREVKVENGQIYVRGPCRFKGYLENDILQKPFDQDGWFKTSDRGEWTKSGALNVLGRSDRVFISAGENIQPELIERALLDFPGILKARVVPGQDDEYGFCPLAFVSQEGLIDPKKLREFLRSRLSGLQMPKTVQDWSAMPEHLRTAKDL